MYPARTSSWDGRGLSCAFSPSRDGGAGDGSQGGIDVGDGLTGLDVGGGVNGLDAVVTMADPSSTSIF